MTLILTMRKMMKSQQMKIKRSPECLTKMKNKWEKVLKLKKFQKL